MRIFRTAAAVAILFSALGVAPLQAQGEDEGIRVAVSAAPTEVPQNRTALVTIRLEWAGDLDRYEIIRFEDPLVENLSIIETARANKVQVIGGLKVARQENQYTVRPDGLGMAYVDGIVIRYTDRETGKEYRLNSSRLELKVIDPLPGPVSRLWLVLLFALVFVALIAWYLLRRIRARRAEAERLARERMASQVTPELKYSERLRAEVELGDPDLDVNAAFGRLAGVLRRYLAEKYSLPLISATTSEVSGLMTEAGANERAIGDALTILKSADVAKFSGAAQMRSELERAYTILEGMLSTATALRAGAESAKKDD